MRTGRWWSRLPSPFGPRSSGSRSRRTPRAVCLQAGCPAHSGLVELAERRERHDATVLGAEPLPRQCAGNSLRRFGRRHEQSERTARKRRKSKVPIEGRRFFTRRFAHEGENRKRTSRPNPPTNGVGEQKTADPFTADLLVTRETPDASRRNGVVARQTPGMFGRQIVDGEG